ncbi:MAG: DUF1553 domain-containing protein [Gemmata sp.]
MTRSYRGPEVPLATDLEFQRRVYLDLVGRGPTVRETEAFLARLREAPGDSRLVRAQLIDDLLEREEFTRYFAKVLEVMLTERREVLSMLGFRAWIRQWLEERRPLNELFAEVLAADGSGDDFRPHTSFFLNRNAEPHLVTRDVGRIVLGRDVQCAQCHDHPHVADYKQAEYFGLLAFVNRSYQFTDAKQGNKLYLGERADGELEFSSVFKKNAGKSAARPGLPMAIALDAEPDFLDTNDAYIVRPEKDQRGVPRYSRRQQLAVLATHPENELFSRNLANRLWAIMLGTGIVNPVDMHHSANPPVSAELLRLLADELVRGRYDVRAILREVARSRTYQRSVVSPDLRKWPGPEGGVEGLDKELAAVRRDWDALQPLRHGAEVELANVTKMLEAYQGDVDKVQTLINVAKKELQDYSGQRHTEVLKLTEVETRQSKAQETIVALQSTLKEVDKLLQVTPEEQLKTVRANLSARLTAATEAKLAADKEVPTQLKAVRLATERVEDQRYRVLGLTSRKLALFGFVAEARGGVRRAQSHRLSLQDRQSDLDQRQSQLTALKDWLSIRDRPSAAKAERDRQHARVLEMWRRSYALRTVRGLNGEQLGGAIYHALELDQPVRTMALRTWDAKHQADPKLKSDAAKRQQFVANAVAQNFWDTLEKTVMRRFSAPAGAPQDGFHATVDQALLLQNDPSVQSWLKPNPGTLVHRLAEYEDDGKVAEQVYLAVLGRTPDREEIAYVTKLLKENPTERAAILRELVWGLLASSEFRFSS